MEGILNVDKPLQLTSHDVVNRVRRTAGMRRVGHSGTLDPLATGVLLLCLGRATRLAEYVTGLPKTYVATVRLGQTTQTYDAEGEVVAERPFTHLTPTAVTQALASFRGDIWQQPPMYSAVKVDGQRLYKLARQGKQVDRPPRPVTIYELVLEAAALPELTLRVTCSAGTYIRSLAHDLGESLGCGAHLSGLRRTRVGQFDVAAAVPLDTLTTDMLPQTLLPLDTAVAHLPRLDCTAAEADDLLNGRFIPNLSPPSLDPLARAYDEDGRFIGIVSQTNDAWRPRKMFHPAE